MRLIWQIGGLVSLGLAVAGALLPLLPTTPFLLLAAYCFARSSPRLYIWLTTHPRFGVAILDWQRHGAISRRAKVLAAGTMAATFLATVVFGAPIWLIIAQAVVMGGAATFVLSRPDPP